MQTDQGYDAVEIDFLSERTLDEGDCIEIDGVIFNHVKAFEKVDDQSLTLPASKITKGGAKKKGRLSC